MAEMTLDRLLAETRHALSRTAAESAGLDARLLVEHFTGTSRIDALRNPDMAVAASAVAAVGRAVERRVAGEPVHRIIGEREFHGLPLRLSRGTLEPRPDTEVLADLAIAQARLVADRTGRCRLLDLGTGTGAVALAVLHDVPEACALGVDILPDALETAATNADINGVGTRFATRESNWFDAIDGTFHIIVSNPPYISTSEMAELPHEVKGYDPHLALHGGEDGLNAYRAIADGAAARLEDQGIVAVEIGYRQRDAVVELFERRGYALLESARDFGGNDRALVFSI